VECKSLVTGATLVIIELPYNDYFEYYGPDFKLHISPSNMANQNTTDYVDKIKTRLFENLRMLPHAPGVQMHGESVLLLAIPTLIVGAWALGAVAYAHYVSWSAIIKVGVDRYLAHYPYPAGYCTTRRYPDPTGYFLKCGRVWVIF